jgi:NOL1/NOP2/fmu family ribosome biogenesis protein
MFRKNAEEALSEWSEENVAMCAERQAHILEEATKMLRVGGQLVYSTCTFSTEEDEGQVQAYLQKHNEMRLVKQEKLYPHKVDGEGHFAALFEKIGSTAEWDSRIKECKLWVSQEAQKAYKEFEKKFFSSRFATRLYEAGGVLYDLPEGVFDWKGIQVLRVGVRLGEVKNGRFEPSHSLAMCINKEECANVLELDKDSEDVKKYFRGETLNASNLDNGWCLVCMDGFPIGLGKVVNGTVKNHYPKGLRC